MGRASTNAPHICGDSRVDIKSFLPFSDWKKAVGLFVIVVLFVAIASKYGIQSKASKIVGG